MVKPVIDLTFSALQHLVAHGADSPPSNASASSALQLPLACLLTLLRCLTQPTCFCMLGPCQRRVPFGLHAAARAAGPMVGFVRVSCQDVADVL